MALFAVVGCAEGDPERSRLAEAQEVTVFERDSSAVRVETKPGEGDGGEAFAFVPNGTKAMVVADEGESSDLFRPVRAVVKGGGVNGLVVSIPRDKLRP